MLFPFCILLRRMWEGYNRVNQCDITGGLYTFILQQMPESQLYMHTVVDPNRDEQCEHRLKERLKDGPVDDFTPFLTPFLKEVC